MDEDGQGEDAGPDVPEFSGWGEWKFHGICGKRYISGDGFLFLRWLVRREALIRYA